MLYHRRVPFRYSQFVHRSGLAFVQCLPDGKGFVWLDNKFYTESKLERSRAGSLSIKDRVEVLRQEFRAFCADKDKLSECYATARRGREQEWEQQGYVANRKMSADELRTKAPSRQSSAEDGQGDFQRV